MFNTKTNETPIESKPMNQSVPYRLNLTLNSEAKSELETLKVRTQKSSLVDVLRAALTVYKVIIDLQEAGGRVVFRKKDNTEETLRFV
jgi:hypothetical protein